MRTYGEVIAIRHGSGPAHGAADVQSSGLVAPGNQFLWRGRIYVIRSVLAHWIESGTWWSSLHQPARSHFQQPADGLNQQLPITRSITRDVGATERWVWRVEAAAGSSAPIGVYDLACEVNGVISAEPIWGQWRLARALD
jgi:hypothetical protein